MSCRSGPRTTRSRTGTSCSSRRDVDGRQGNGDWTTLPDLNGHTSQETGASCAGGWGEQLHARTLNYQTHQPNGPGPDDDSCLPTGTTGAWHAASGNSGGWQEWSSRPDALRWQAGRALDRVRDRLGHADGARHAGRRHERSPSTAAWPPRPRSRRTGGWEVPGAHRRARPQNAERLDALAGHLRGRGRHEDGRVVSMFGFGLEGVDTPEARRDLMQRTLGYLLSG